jgi:hypothetical protein
VCLPYKGLDYLKSKITEACVKRWADSLKPGAKTTLYNVQKYLEWVKAKGYFPTAQAMLDDQKKCRKSDDENEEFKHLEMECKSEGTLSHMILGLLSERLNS